MSLSERGWNVAAVHVAAAQYLQACIQLLSAAVNEPVQTNSFGFGVTCISSQMQAVFQLAPLRHVHTLTRMQRATHVSEVHAVLQQGCCWMCEL